MSAWHQVAVVVRSHLHDRTWVAHIEDTDFDNTPAGPLRLVKEEVQRQAWTWGWVTEVRWRNPDGDTWALQVKGSNR